jgi:hypothetical protein
MRQFYHEFAGDRDTQKGPYNRCIYCGCTDLSKLSDEHVMAEALGGRLILKMASCRTCNDTINRFESQVHNNMFADVLAHVAIVKTKSQGRRGKFPLYVEIDGKNVAVKRPIADHPTMLWLPSWPLPGICTQDEPRYEFRDPRLWAWSLGPQDEFLRKAGKVARETGASKVVLHGAIWGGSFARYLAKTAHCLAVALFGLDEFSPLLPDVILNKEGPVAYLVGTASTAEPVRSATPHYEATLFTGQDVNTGRSLLMCKLRLFAWLTTPVYLIIIGDPTEQLLARFLGDDDPVL